jgi:TonB family protein
VTAARPRLSDLLAPELKPYLYYSAGAHLAIALLALRLLGAAGSAGKSTVYTIDFVGGPASVITSAGPAAPAPAAQAPAPPPKPGPSAEFDEFGRRKGRKTRFVLPRPSLLRGAQAPKPREDEEEKPAAAEGKAAAGAAGGQTGAPGDAGSAGVSADMPNFPYPWYITQVRQMLWQRWQASMPSGPGESVVVFSIMPNGSVVDLRTETSSGDGSFDLAALAAVQDASPYPPLPAQFTEPFLKVHVTLRSQ